MSKPANQLHAAFIISKYSLLATFKSPTSVVFSLLFPIIFITVFGSVNVGKPPVMKLAVSADSDTANAIFRAIKEIPSISLQTGMTVKAQEDGMKKGRIAGMLAISADSAMRPMPHYTINLKTSPSAQNVGLMETLLGECINKINQKIFPGNASVAKLAVTQEPGRVYKSIDFILPGQLGFSLLMAGVYGSSYLLFNLRQNLVLKRLRATPVKRRSIIAGEMLSHLLFHVISFMIMVAIGYYAFGFNLVDGAATFMEMLVFSLFGLCIFMGIGFIISGVVQNENAISPIANTVVLPQILLCGLFFPVENYPNWMQHFCNALPLTMFVDGLRKIAFENIHIWQMPLIVCGLIIWTLIIGPLAVKAFRWE